MSFVPSFFLIFLLLLSMHACLARHLGFVKVAEGGTMKEGVDGGKMNQESKLESKIVRQSSGHDPVPVSVSWTVPSKNTTKHSGFLSDYSMPRMRSEIFMSSSLLVPLKATKIEGSTRRGLSVVRFGSIFDKKANKNKVQEDTEMIDYDPPHRTPPIHNKKIKA